jgi:ABC-type amino acid transport substrate-binding protein
VYQPTPPLFFTNEDGSPDGIAIDYLKLISERTGVNFYYYYVSDKTFGEALDGLKKHLGPDLFPVLTSTPERQREILFSKEYLKSPYVI